MYKFTNGIVVFDKKTRDKYVKAGYKLLKTNIKEEKNDKDSVDNRVVESKSKGSDKTSK